MEQRCRECARLLWKVLPNGHASIVVGGVAYEAAVFRCVCRCGALWALQQDGKVATANIGHA